MINQRTHSAKPFSIMDSPKPAPKQRKDLHGIPLDARGRYEEGNGIYEWSISAHMITKFKIVTCRIQFPLECTPNFGIRTQNNN